MNETELRFNAALSEVSGQRNMALERCAALQAEIAVLKVKLEEAEKPKAETAHEQQCESRQGPTENNMSATIGADDGRSAF